MILTKAFSTIQFIVESYHIYCNVIHCKTVCIIHVTLDYVNLGIKYV